MASRRQNLPSTLTRKIQFFRANTGHDANGRAVPFDARRILSHLDGIALSSGQRHWEHETGAATCCWVDLASAFPRMRLANIRLTGLPMLEERGVLGELVIPSSAGLAEQVHVVFFPDNVVGAEYNHYGPRISRLRDYLSARAAAVCPATSFEPLMRSDALEQLRSIRSLRLLRLRIRPSFIGRVKDANPALGATFEAARGFAGGEVLEFTARAEPHNPNSSLLAQVKEVAQTLYEVIRSSDTAGEEVTAFEISGFDLATGRLTNIDLLSDMLVSSQQIVAAKGRTRALDAESAFTAIERAYAEVQPQLPAAAALVA